ncbi:MAG TPA: hypothetical protein VMD56_10005 [Steroidobacteraceae bacterium]|nr:hypothetical protein [Steroidobacteraceae bacterium]
MSAEQQAPIDLRGYWVSLITQNWRFRMLVPGPGEYADIPINEKAKQFADVWKAAADEAAGKQCEAYGAAVLMRNPERLHISWLDAETLRVDTDAGMQTRLLHFKPAAPAGPAAPGKPGTPGTPAVAMGASLQGFSLARWVMPGGGGFLAAPAAANGGHYGSLQVSTDHLEPGLLRKNGVPYGARTTMSEWWDLRVEPTGDQWLSISTTVRDPEYLQGPYLYDSVFQKEPDGSKWDPEPCSLSF